MWLGWPRVTGMDPEPRRREVGTPPAHCWMGAQVPLVTSPTLGHLRGHSSGTWPATKGFCHPGEDRPGQSMVPGAPRASTPDTSPWRLVNLHIYLFIPPSLTFSH